MTVEEDNVVSATDKNIPMAVTILTIKKKRESAIELLSLSVPRFSSQIHRVLSIRGVDFQRFRKDIMPDVISSSRDTENVIIALRIFTYLLYLI